MDINDVVSGVSRARAEAGAAMATDMADLGVSPQIAQLITTLMADGFLRGIRLGWKQRQEVEGMGLDDAALNARLAHVLEAVELGLEKGGAA